MASNRLVIDANIFLEALLKQERAKECASFLNKLQDDNLEIAITAFSLFAAAIRLEKVGKQKELAAFITGCIESEYEIYQPTFTNQQEAVKVCARFSLDFDDAQQYVAAKELEAVLVSFDADFDKTDLKRVEPKNFLEIHG